MVFFSFSTKSKQNVLIFKQIVFFVLYIRLEKAVEANHVQAHYELGRMYTDGLGVEKDFTKAIALYYFITKKYKNRTLPNLKKYGFVYTKHVFFKIDLFRKSYQNCVKTAPKWTPKCTGTR